MNLFQLISRYESDPAGFVRQYQSETITVYVPKNGGPVVVRQRNMEIRRRLRAGEQYQVVADAFGLTVRQVRRIQKTTGDKNDRF